MFLADEFEYDFILPSIEDRHRAKQTEDYYITPKRLEDNEWNFNIDDSI